MHLYAGAIIELQGGDMCVALPFFLLASVLTVFSSGASPSLSLLPSLGHECMGIVESVGPGVTKLKVGDRVVAGFNIGCGECYMCEQKLSSACTKTNNSALMNTMYGGRTCGMLGYSHFTGGFAGSSTLLPWFFSHV
jgi:threonine dehydrogenase-like Zn-dependent dehydrogenase